MSECGLVRDWVRWCRWALRHVGEATYTRTSAVNKVLGSLGTSVFRFATSHELKFGFAEPTYERQHTTTHEAKRRTGPSFLDSPSG